MRERAGGNVKLSGLSLGDLAATPDINLQSSSGGNRALICLSAAHLPYRSSASLPILFSSLLAPAAATAAADADAASSFDIFTMRISSLHAGEEMPISPKPLSPRWLLIFYLDPSVAPSRPQLSAMETHTHTHTSHNGYQAGLLLSAGLRSFPLPLPGCGCDSAQRTATSNLRHFDGSA